jgi:hypothetical protein
VRKRIASASAVDARRVRIEWRDGAVDIIDLRPLLVRFMKRPMTSRDAMFRTVRAAEDGSAITWADGSLVSARWLEDLALAEMSSAEFRTASRAKTMTIEEIAAHLGLSRRTVAGYRTNRPIPRAVALAMRFMLHRRDLDPEPSG